MLIVPKSLSAGVSGPRPSVAAHTRTGSRITVPPCIRHSGLQLLHTSDARGSWLTTSAAAPAALGATAVSPQPAPEGVAPVGDGPQRFAEPSMAAAATWELPSGRRGLFDSEGRMALKCLTLPELEAWCTAEGEAAPANRALQLWRWMYADPTAASGGRAWIRSLEETAGRQNGFSKKFIDKVGPRVTLEGGLSLQRVVRSSDGTRKLVFSLVGGEAAGGSVETVLIPVVRQQGLRDRLTICVSSQVGCAMNCQFCYTGRMGLLGNLSTAQIVEQVVEARRFLAQEGDTTPLTNLVFMGMGEPLHNTEAVLAATDIVSHYLGLHISHNKVTISTVGLVPEMRQVVARTRVQMALSLHATTDEVRDWIVPVNRRYDLATLVGALEELFPRPAEKASSNSSASGNGITGTASQSQLQHQQQHQGQHEAGPHGVSSSTSSPAPTAHLAGTASSSSSSSPCSASPASASSPHQRWLPPVDAQPTSSGSSHEEPHAPAGPAAALDRSASGAAASSSSSGSTAEGAGGGTAAAAGEGRSLLIEYTMLHGINDTLEDAHRLADMMARVNCKINLICFNPHSGTRFRPSTDEDVCAFRSVLIQRGYVCTIRDSRGDDEMAACGQLGNVGLAFRPSPILEAPERFRPFLLPPPEPQAQNQPQIHTQQGAATAVMF